MQITPELIGWGITIVAGVFIVLSFFLGAIRGLRKSLFRFFWILGWGIVCLLFSGLIAKALVNVDISFLHLSVNGEAISTLPEYIQKVIATSNPDISQMMMDNPQVFELCTEIAICVLNLFFFEVLFWVVKWVLYPIWAILAKIFFGKKRQREKRTEDGVYIKDRAPKKHAFFGALVGIATGLVIAFFAFVPLSGISSAIITLERETTVEYDGATQPGVVSQYAGEYVDYIYAYENSLFGQTLKYTGLRAAQDVSSNILTSTNFEGTKINLQSEIKELAPIYVDYTKLANYDFNNLSQQDLGDIIPIIDDLQQHTLSSGILQSVYDEVVPYLIKNVLTRDDYFIQLPNIDNENLDTMMKNSIRAVFGITEDNQIDETKLIKISDIKSDISKMLGIVSDINDAGILAEMINGTITEESFRDKITPQLGRDIVDKIFETTVISRLTPVITEPLTKFVVELIPEIDYDGTQTSITYYAVDGGVTNQNVKEFMQQVVASSIQIYKNVDTSSDIYVSSSDLGSIGVILDKLHNGKIISSATFESAVNYLEVFAKKSIAEAGLDADLRDMVNVFVDNLSSIGSFELEFTKIGQAYKIYSDATEFDIEVGAKMLDKIKGMDIYTSSIDEVLEKATTFLTNYITTNNVPLATDNIDDIVDSIKDINSFETEYNAIKPLIDFIKDTGLENITSDANLATLGEKFDDCIANGSVLLSSDNLKIIAKNFIAKIELPNDIKNITFGTKTIKEVLQENIDDLPDYDSEVESTQHIYQNELKYINQLLNANISSISDIKNSLIDADANDDKLIGLDGNSKSRIMDNDVLRGIVVELVGNVNIDEISGLVADMQTSINDSNANCKDILEQLEDVQTAFDDMKVVPSTITRAYLVELGAKVDAMSTDYPIIINSDAQIKIGDYIANQINQKVQDDSSIPQSTKNSVAGAYANRANYATYEALLTEFADYLGL